MIKIWVFNAKKVCKNRCKKIIITYNKKEAEIGLRKKVCVNQKPKNFSDSITQSWRHSIELIWDLVIFQKKKSIYCNLLPTSCVSKLLRFLKKWFACFSNLIFTLEIQQSRIIYKRLKLELVKQFSRFQILRKTKKNY